MNIVIFDTETVGVKTQSLLNVGYKICDVNIQNATAETLIERNYLVTDLINNRSLMLNDMFVGAEKYEKMEAEKKRLKAEMNKLLAEKDNLISDFEAQNYISSVKTH